MCLCCYIFDFQYICALVQEVHLKIDQGILTAMMDFFEPEKEILDEDIKEFLHL